MIDESTWKAWEERMASNDRNLRPIAKGSVSLEDLMKPVSDRDKQYLKDVSEENQGFVGELIDAYSEGSEEERQRIRSLFVTYNSFAWCVDYRMQADTNEELRRKFVYLSILDQMLDTRDYLLKVRELVQFAKNLDLDHRTIMKEVSAISSDVDRFGWGTTKQILIDES